MSKQDIQGLERVLGLLERLEASLNWAGMEHVEKYARDQYEACKERAYGEEAKDAETYMANSMYARGQGDTWLFLAELRTRVPEEIANVRRRLDAQRKEE